MSQIESKEEQLKNANGNDGACISGMNICKTVLWHDNYACGVHDIGGCADIVYI